MKDFWKKTKESFAVGVAKADEFISDKKIVTDPEYLQRENLLNDMDEAINHLHKNLEEMNGSIKRIYRESVLRQLPFIRLESTLRFDWRTQESKEEK